MEPTEVKQKFAAILAADAEGCMCLLREAKEEAFGTPTEHRAIIDGSIDRHGRAYTQHGW